MRTHPPGALGVKRQLALDLAARERLAAQDFLPAASNRAALAVVTAWPAWPSTAAVVTGPPGSGKTHLAGIWAKRVGALALDAAEVWSIADPLRRLGDACACVIDDADAVEDEVLLLQLYNLLQERGGHLLLTGTLPLHRWHLALPDLLSRLRTAWAASIEPPDDALLRALLAKHFHDRQLRVPAAVLDCLAAGMTPSFAAARRVAAALDSASLLAGRPITTRLANGVLADLAPKSAPPSSRTG